MNAVLQLGCVQLLVSTKKAKEYTCCETGRMQDGRQSECGLHSLPGAPSSKRGHTVLVATRRSFKRQVHRQVHTHGERKLTS